MKTSTNALIAIFSFVMVGVVASSVLACGGSSYNRSGGDYHRKPVYAQRTYSAPIIARSFSQPALAPQAVAPAAEVSLPSVAAGSTLSLAGREIGTERGSARLRLSSLALPIAILKWTNDSAEIELPRLELTAPMKAEIDVLRADGTVVSTTAVLLTPAASQVAARN